MDKLLLILTLLAGTAYAVVNPTGKTHNSANTVVCADGKRWTVCAPGNIPDGPAPEGDPYLAFSDLITGPDTGLGDGNGSGVIVTVWGQNLGSTQGSSTIQYRDSTNTARNGHVYYWKNADGTLPSGPANLYESHGMQEIAFSIPDSALGAGTIEVTVDGDTSTLPFTVRAGSIYHVTSSGNDSTGDGSFASPWLTVEKGDSTAGAGDTLYIHDISTYGSVADSGSTKERGYYNNTGFQATEANQFAYVSYPGKRANIYAKHGVAMYLTTGIVSSKLSVKASNCADETLVGCTESGTLGISPSDWGRVVGNSVTDRDGMCASGQAGAISGGINTVEGAKVFGNHIYEYGCENSSKLHHTTYLTIRDGDGDKSIAPFEMGWNYLKDNPTKNGIHVFDEDNSHTSSCGDLTGDLLLHDNVVVDQGSNGIFYGVNCGWTQNTYIYNNLVIRSGYESDVDCVSNCGSYGSGITLEDGENLGDIHLFNNTVIDWDNDNQESALQTCIGVQGGGNATDFIINDNACLTAKDREFFQAFDFSAQSILNLLAKTTGNGNAFFTTASNPARAVVPAWESNAITTDPLLTVTGSKVEVGSLSPLKSMSTRATFGSPLKTLTHDLYGTARTATTSVGAIQ